MGFPKRIAGALAISGFLHGVVLYPEYSVRPFVKMSAYMSDKYSEYKARKEKEAIQEERKKLIAQARKDLKKGILRLGEFMLKGNHLDAREEGRPFDISKARQLKEGYEAKFGYEISAGKVVPQATPEVFKDIDYYGRPGGKMALALMEKMGSCEQLSHLIASVVYDTADKEHIYLRNYGANSEGIAHIAPVFVQGTVEYDLLAGAIAKKKQSGEYAGYKFHASGLVEAYARAHDLAPLVAENKRGQCKGQSGATGEEGKKARSGLTIPKGEPSGFGYEGASDSYGEGVPPLFAKNAVKRFTGAEQKEGEVLPAGQAQEGQEAKGNVRSSNQQQAKENEGDERIFLRQLERLKQAYFRPNKYRSSYFEGTVNVMPVDKPKNEILDDFFSNIETARKYADSYQKKPGRRLLYLGQMAGLCEHAEFYARLTGKHRIAEMAVEQRKKAMDAAKEMIEKDKQLHPTVGTSRFVSDLITQAELSRIDISGLIFLGPKAREILFDIAEETPYIVYKSGIWSAGGEVGVGPWENRWASDYIILFEEIKSAPESAASRVAIGITDKNRRKPSSKLELSPGVIVTLPLPSNVANRIRLDEIGKREFHASIFSVREHPDEQGLKALAALISRDGTRERATRIAENFQRTLQMDLFKGLAGTELDCSNEFCRAFNAFNELEGLKLTIVVTSEQKEAIGGILGIGESLEVYGYRLKLQDVDGDAAVIRFTAPNGGTIISKIHSGHDMFYGGTPVHLKVKKVSPGYAFGAKWADVAILSGEKSANFSILLKEVQKILNKYNLSKEWEAPFIEFRAMKTYISFINVTKLPIEIEKGRAAFLAQMQEWLDKSGKDREDLKEFRDWIAEMRKGEISNKLELAQPLLDKKERKIMAELSRLRARGFEEVDTDQKGKLILEEHRLMNELEKLRRKSQ